MTGKRLWTRGLSPIPRWGVERFYGFPTDVTISLSVTPPSPLILNLAGPSAIFGSCCKPLVCLSLPRRVRLKMVPATKVPPTPPFVPCFARLHREGRRTLAPRGRPNPVAAFLHKCHGGCAASYPSLSVCHSSGDSRIGFDRFDRFEYEESVSPRNQPPKPSPHQPIAPWLGDQQARIRGIGLDLLP